MSRDVTGRDAATVDRQADRVAPRKSPGPPLPGSLGSGRTLGPVSDLERHLPEDWWRTLFNSVYLLTDGDVVENEKNTADEVDLLIDALALTANDSILDLCCGQGRHCLELARRGFRDVTGLDRSRYLIRLARRRAKTLGVKAKFREGDARRLPAGGGSYDAVIIMGNSFGYFGREEDDRAVLSAVFRALKPGGRLAIDVTDGDWMRTHFDLRSWEWIDQTLFVCRERSLSADGDRLVCREVVVHAEKGVIADQFYAERLYSRTRIRSLVERAGFGDIAFHDEIGAQSDRVNGGHGEHGIDLGMMARRNFLSATRRDGPVPAALRLPIFSDVAVLLGDPRLPDAVKKNGVFNDEDMATVARLSEALGKLKDYRFKLIDRHDDLISRLHAEAPDFVFNLCDEGYRNEAAMELHVPAVLDMLGVPYSGAGPAALGLCYDKALVSAVARACDIPVPLETYSGADDQASTLPAIFPALIKPAMGDSSIGITAASVVESPSEAVAQIADLQRQLPGRPMLIQEFLTGPEYTVGLIGNPGIDLMALPILTVDYGGLDPALPKILGYESKWLPDSPYWTDIRYVAAALDERVRQRLIDWSSILFERLGCRDYARFDFRADATGTIKLLEVNPNPGWCWDGKMNLMAAEGGHDYTEFLAMILEAAQRRLLTWPCGERARLGSVGARALQGA